MKKYINKIVRRVVSISKPAFDMETKQKFYPVRWEIFGKCVWSGYTPAERQDEILGI